METIHTRFTCWSKLLWDKLLELGFKEKGSDHASMGLKQVKRFEKDNLNIEDSYQGTYLYATIDQPGIKSVPTPTKILRYHGMSVNSELLSHFAKKGIYDK